MKTNITIIAAFLALASIGLHAQSTNTAPITLTVPPVPRPTEQIAPLTLDAAHSAAFLAAIGAVITLPANTTPVSGGYRVAIVNGAPIVTIYGAVKPNAPVTSQ